MTTSPDAKGRQRAALLECLCRPRPFSRYMLKRPLRAYQLEPARAIVDSVLHRRGLTFAVMMSRQAGKNETAAQVEALLLNLFRRRGGWLVKAAPTLRPQAETSLRRLQEVLAGSTLPAPTVEAGNILAMGEARARFMSASLRANVVGATANILLEADEAQDIDRSKWNKDFRPMGASTGVTTVLWGTAWTSNTLLAETMRQLAWASAKDGRQRVFRVPWEVVAESVPAYGRYVRGEIERLGHEHPLIRTQYCLEEIDAGGGMFPPATQALMRGSHARQRQPTEGREYAMLVDVAGPSEERTEGAMLRAEQPRKDSTALTVVEIVRGELGLPRFLIVDRHLWTGTPHPDLYGAITHLAEMWRARQIVVDATGVGAGLASFLQRALGDRVRPFTFTAASKSELGWAFLGICNSGRLLDHRDDASPEQAQFWREVRGADYEVLAGPDKRMRWGVADPAIHDDLLISAALCAALDVATVRPTAPTQIVEATDALKATDALRW